MTINVEAKLAAQCDKCGTGFSDGDSGYCSGCWNDLKADLATAEKDRDDFERDLNKAEEWIEELKQEIASLQK